MEPQEHQTDRSKNSPNSPTGTPVQNDLNEFYAMMEFANPNLLGPLSAFKRLYADPIERSRDRSASTEEKDIGQERSMGLQKRTQFCILRRSASINNKYLPPKTEYIVFCRPQPFQISLYLEFCSSVVSHAIQSTSPSAKVLLAICMLRKLCNHPKFVDNTFSEAMDTGLTSGFVESLVDIDGKEGSQKQPLQYRFEPAENGLSGKLQCLDSLLSAVFNPSSNTMDRVVIVSNFTQCLDMIQGLCDHRCWKWLRLDGTTDSSSRQQLVDHFNKGFGDELIFLLSSKAGGTGLNLIGANRLVLFDPDWNPAIDAQAMARIWREGQPKPVIIYRLLTTGSIEEKIYQRQVMKGEFAATIEGHGEARFLSKKGGQHFSREELQELFTLRLDTYCDTYDLLSRSKMSNLEDWKDYSKVVTDFALKHAIQSGIITFVHQTTNNSSKIVC